MKQIAISIACCALSANVCAKEYNTELKLNQYTMDELVSAMEILQAKQQDWQTAYYFNATPFMTYTQSNGFSVGGAFQVSQGHSAISVGMNLTQFSVLRDKVTEPKTEETVVAEPSTLEDAVIADAVAVEATEIAPVVTEVTMDIPVADPVIEQVTHAVRMFSLPMVEGLIYGSPYSDASIFIGAAAAPTILTGPDVSYALYYHVRPCVGYEIGRNSAMRVRLTLGMDLFSPITKQNMGALSSVPTIGIGIGF